MRTLISTSFVSLDGKLDPTGGDPGLHDTQWTFKTVDFLPEAYELKGREQEEAGALLLGRRSYQLFAPVWPGMAEFARYKTLPKYVVSTTLEEDDLVDDWGETTVLRSVDEVAQLKDTDGDPLLVQGSATLNRALQEAGLIDRYHLLVFPLVLGTGGKRLFADDGGKTKLQLVDTTTYANGVQLQIFRPAR